MSKNNERKIGVPIVFLSVRDRDTFEQVNTQTHILVGAALLMRPGGRARNAAVFAGALIPDLAIYLMYGNAKWTGLSEHAIWSELFVSPAWQGWITVANSIPIYAALVLLALAKGWMMLTVFSLAALAHIALDFFVHHDDAHRHFWPISDWRFASPLSYWDPAYYGTWVSFAEFGLGAALAALLWRRFEAPFARALLVVALLAYIAVPLHWAAA